MATRGPVYGLDAELKAKQAAAYSKEDEVIARQFIAEKTGETSITEGEGPEQLQEVLMDGVILCKLADILKPGSVAGAGKPTKMPFKRMENINAFLNFCVDFGVMTANTFQTVDLYEGQNMLQVVRCICNVKLLSEGKGALRSSAHKEVKTDHSIPSKQTAGYTGGANASGINYGLRRQIGGSTEQLK
eukprot:Clim_evm29s77 gene=Clim_evmTU29s77